MDMATTGLRARQGFSAGAIRHWPIAIGLLTLGIPTLIHVARESWTGETGVHGPIVLATGIWLFAQRWRELETIARPGTALRAALLIVPALFAYAVGRAFDFLAIEVLALGGFLLGLFYLFFGSEAVRRMWFPLVYLLFVVPIPGWLIDTVTGPLKAYVSHSATYLLGLAGYPIVREGVTLYVAQYQLLVEDACAGLNSLISLTAISLFYIYVLHNASWRYALFLMLWIVPVALLANLLRVIILVLITYHFGNAAAQGFLHSTAGLVMFATALLGIFAVDRLMTPVRRLLTQGTTR